MTTENIISALVAFAIACLGWFILQWRTNKTSKRSETFSMLSSAFTVLEQLEELAEEHLKNIKKATDIEDNLLLRQIFSAQILAKANFFRAKIEYLEKRGIYLEASKHIELRDKLTMSDFSTITEYQQLLNLTSNIRNELYKSFHLTYSA
jgi:DNA primase large subunit